MSVGEQEESKGGQLLVGKDNIEILVVIYLTCRSQLGHLLGHTYFKVSYFIEGIPGP